MKRILLLSLFGALLLAPTYAQPEAKQVLITGFGPWGWRDSNPSWEGAKLLEGEVIEGHTVVARQLEVDYRKVRDAIPKLLAEVKSPAVVIHFGVGGSRFEFERKARNKAHWSDDDSGYAPEDGRVTHDGAMIYSSGLPEKKIKKALKNHEPPMKTSTDAGAYLCEFTFYLEMYHQDKGSIGSDAGFIHVPYMNNTVTAELIAGVMRTSIRATLLERPPVASPSTAPDTEQKTSGPAAEDSKQGATGALPTPGGDGD